MNTFFDLKKATISLIEDGIIELKFKNNITFELADAMEVDEIFRKLVNNKPYYVLVDGASVISTLSEEARSHFSKKNDINIHRKAEALVASNFTNRIIANLYMAINRPNNPVKVFADREDALAWLKDLKTNNDQL